MYKRNANLARIRDNQRRSRAKRKEYLQELETKYRSCEQVGVEASAEIQAAARRVVDENRRLRQLLKQQGLSDAEIDGMPAHMPENAQYPTAANALESMINQRRSCGPSDCRDSSAGRRSSCASSLSTQQLQAQRLPLQQPQHVMPQRGALDAHYASPVSSVTSGIPTPNNAHFPASQSNSYSSTSTTNQPTLDYGMQYDDPFTWDAQYQTSQAATNNTSSCYVAAGAIRDIRPDVGYELEHELGCSDGRECSVPNTRVFSLMDRYSEGS